MSVDLGEGVTLLERSDTGVTYAGRSKMRLPVRDVRGHHSVTSGREGSVQAAIVEARELDAIGKSVGHRGKSYSFGIPRVPGLVIEGQGLYLGAHTLGHNSTALGVVLYGNYQNVHRVENFQVHAWHRLRAYLLDIGALVPGVTYPVGDHQSTGFPTACWGDNARARMADFRAAAASAPAPSLPKGHRMFAVHLIAAPEIGYPQGGLFVGVPGSWLAASLADYARALNEGHFKVIANGRSFDLWNRQLHPVTLKPLTSRPAA